MQNSPITLADIATIAAIAAVIFGGIFQGLRFLTEYLSAKFTPPQTSANDTSPVQSMQIEALIATQNRNMEKMLDQNGKQLDAIAAVSHQAELRHQIVLAKLDRIETLHCRP